MTPQAIQQQPTIAFDAQVQTASYTGATALSPGRHAAEDPPGMALKAGQVLYEAGAFTEDVWLVDSGALRLDLVGDGNERFVQLAVRGDCLGIEPRCNLPTLYRATAVTRCVLRRLDLDTPQSQHAVVSGALVQQWCRAADQIALRTGSAGERVRQLLLLLAGGVAVSADGSTAIELPRLTDIAAIVDTAPETVSRILSHWRREGVLMGTAAGSLRLDGRRLAACEIAEGITRSAARSGPSAGRNAPLVRGR